MDSRAILQRTLSFTALGVLADFLNRPRTWKIRLSEITQSLRLSTEEAAAILSELTEKGFAVERRDPYGVYYDIYAYPENGAAGNIPGRGGQCPSADPGEQTSADPGRTAAAQGPVSKAPEKPGGMTDEERARNLELIRKLFPPTKDYKSPYRD